MLSRCVSPSPIFLYRNHSYSLTHTPPPPRRFFLLPELPTIFLTNIVVQPSTIDGVWLADGLLPESLRMQLLREVSKLESEAKDWHPGSNGQVLDLVHPSLFCVVAGITRQTIGSRTSPLRPHRRRSGSLQLILSRCRKLTVCIKVQTGNLLHTQAMAKEYNNMMDNTSPS